MIVVVVMVVMMVVVVMLVVVVVVLVLVNATTPIYNTTKTIRCNLDATLMHLQYKLDAT